MQLYVFPSGTHSAPFSQGSGFSGQLLGGAVEAVEVVGSVVGVVSVVVGSVVVVSGECVTGGSVTGGSVTGGSVTGGSVGGSVVV